MPDRSPAPLDGRALTSMPGQAIAQPGPERDAAPNVALPWVVRLRYGMVAGGLAALASVGYVFGFDDPLVWALVPLVVVLVTNVWLHRVAHRWVRSPQATLGVIFALDTLCLTAVLSLTGGPMNPFSLLYLVQITLAAVVLKRMWTVILGALSAVCFGLLFFLQVPFPGSHMTSAEHSLLPHLAGMWIAFVVAAALIGFFAGRVSDSLRLREQEVLILQEHIARQERLASLVTLAAGAAHELGTPLGTIAVVARELERYASTLASGSELGDDARLIRSEVERCQRILQRMSADGAEPMGESPQRIAAETLLQETLHEIPETRRSLVSFDTGDAGHPLFLPLRATVQALAALLANAIDAGAGEVRVVLRVRCTESEAVLSVIDDGPGMSEEVLRRIAEPFFTTKDPGRGMGLGTFLARTFAERLGGGLMYESTPGMGTTATLFLPMQFSRLRESRHVSA